MARRRRRHPPGRGCPDPGAADDPVAVRGRVVDAVSGAAITTAEVTAGSARATTDAGAFELALAPGSWTLTIRRPATWSRRAASPSAPCPALVRHRARPEGAVLRAPRGEGLARRARGARRPARDAGARAHRGRGARQHLPRHPDPARRSGHGRAGQPHLRARRLARREPDHHGRRRDPQPVPAVRPHQRVQSGDGRALRLLGRRLRGQPRRSPVVAPRRREP